MKRSPWTHLLTGHMARQRLSQTDIARFVGVSQATISDYAIGDLLPPLTKLSDLADALSLTGQERESFVEEALLAHAPDRVRALVADLRQRISRLERICQKHGFQPHDA